jgi:two-component system sensor histidine kinase GlrK
MKFGIFPRLTAGYLVVLFLLGASNVYAIRKLIEFNAFILTSYNEEIRLLDAGQKLVDAIFSQQGFEQKYLITKDPLLQDQFLAAREDFERTLAEITVLPTSPARQEVIRKVAAAHGRYQELIGGEEKERKAGRSYDANRYKREKEKAADAVLEALTEMEALSRAGFQQKSLLVSQAGASARQAAVGSFLITLLLVVLLAFLLTRSITTPILRLVMRTRTLDAVDCPDPLAVSAPPEIEELTEAFDRMCERLKETDKIKADFFAMTSHELKTPLTTIREGTSLLLDGTCGPVTPKQHRLLTIITEESNRLAGMVNAILSLSRMEAGMMQYEFVPGRIGPLVAQAVKELMPYAEAKRIRVELWAGEALPACRMDGERILDVLRNLIGNAVKFTPEEGRIVVAAEPANGGLEVSVSDTGPGVPAERRQAIFEKYQSSDQQKGTGLGLAIVKHIVTAHGGRVWVQNAPGVGSRFVFWLPC